MKKRSFSRFLAVLVSLLILTQSLCLTALAAGEEKTVLIPSNSTKEEVNQILTKQLLGENAETVAWEYQCEGTSRIYTKNTAWGSIAGFTSSTKTLGITTTYTHPALAANADGAYQVRVANDPSKAYTINKIAKQQSSITPKENPTVNLVYKEDQSVDYSNINARVFDAVVASTTPAGLTAENVTIEYYATATTGSLGDLGKNWAPLTGGKVNTLTYPAISEGTHQVRITFPGNAAYAKTVIEATLNVTGRDPMTFDLNETPYNVGLVFTAEQAIDYDQTAKAIYGAVVKSTTPEGLTADDMTIEYNAATTNLTKVWVPLEGGRVNLINYPAISEGTHQVRITFPGNNEFAPASVTATVTVTDNRIPSAVVLKDGVSFPYNQEVAAMKQAVLDNVVDWENSTLPAKDTLTINNFTFAYEAQLSLLDGLSGDIADGVLKQFLNNPKKEYVPFEGEKYTLGNQILGQYPQIGAGEQKIRVTYKGNADYKPSAAADGTITVNKAKVKVSVKSTSLTVSEAKNGLHLVTTTPVDDFNIYVIYAGVTRNMTSALYLELPAKYTENSPALKAIDMTLKALGQKTLTQMMQDGITVGELRALLLNTKIIDALGQIGIDTGALGQLVKVIDKLPAVGDDIRIAFGQPNHAGMYSVTAVTENKNYNTGVGVGALVLKADKAKLEWNQDIGKKISAADAKTADFGATLNMDGKAVADQSSVRVLYSGFTSRWKPYSSTTTPPTEPGRYAMTVVVLGGDYQASPISRSFQITR